MNGYVNQNINSSFIPLSSFEYVHTKSKRMFFELSKTPL